MSDQVWLTIFGQLVAAGGMYAAVRADLREALVRIADLKDRVARLENRA